MDDDQPFDLDTLIDEMSPAEREYLAEHGLNGRSDTSGQMPAKKVCTREYEDV